MRGDQEGCPRNTKWDLFLPEIPHSFIHSLLFARTCPFRCPFFVPSTAHSLPYLLLFHRSCCRAHIRGCTTVKSRSSSDCRTEAEICPYFGTGRFPVFTMAQWAHLSSAARLQRRHFIPRARRRAFQAILSGTLFVMRIICPRYSTSSNLWKKSVTVGADDKTTTISIREPDTRTLFFNITFLAFIYMYIYIYISKIDSFYSRNNLNKQILFI